MTKTLSAALLAASTFLAACGDSTVQVITAPIEASKVKFFNFGVNAPGVNFYAGANKITATSSTTGVESTTGTVSGGAGLAGLYATMAPGSYVFTGKIAATVDKDLAISTVNGTLVDGKAYSVFISGIYDAAAKSADGFIVEDAYPAAIDYANAYVRFVNAISNSQPMTLFAKNTTTLAEVPIGAAVAYKNGGAFVAIPGGTYDLGARVGAATTNTISRTAVGFIAGRVYTIGARGDITVTSTTATTRPQLDNTANR